MKKQSNLLRAVACLSITLGLIAGCASKKSADSPAPVTENVVPERTDVVEAAPDSDVTDPAAARSIVYFDFDSSALRDEFRGELQRIAAELIAEPKRTARLEGHADARGSREYNVGLGERRAQAVRQFLILNGVPQVQIVTVSYGEERPAVQGDDEAAWSRNRRVEIVRTNR